MRLNTPEQVANGRRLLARYGSWDRIRAASRYDHKRGGLAIAMMDARSLLAKLEVRG